MHKSLITQILIGAGLVTVSFCAGWLLKPVHPGGEATVDVVYAAEEIQTRALSPEKAQELCREEGLQWKYDAQTSELLIWKNWRNRWPTQPSTDAALTRKPDGSWESFIYITGQFFL